MLLREERRCRQWGTCDVGKRTPAQYDDNADKYKDATVWPQDIKQAPRGYHNMRGEPVPQVDSFALWVWSVYVNMGSGRLGSGYKTWQVCDDHSKNLYYFWVIYAQIEVIESEAWDRHIDRIEA